MSVWLPSVGQDMYMKDFYITYRTTRAHAPLERYSYFTGRWLDRSLMVVFVRLPFCFACLLPCLCLLPRACVLDCLFFGAWASLSLSSNDFQPLFNVGIPNTLIWLKLGCSYRYGYYLFYLPAGLQHLIVLSEFSLNSKSVHFSTITLWGYWCFYVLAIRLKWNELSLKFAKMLVQFNGLLSCLFHWMSYLPLENSRFFIDWSIFAGDECRFSWS